MSAALGLALLAAASWQGIGLEPSVVKVERGEQGERWTVRARQASPRLLLERVAELGGLELAGLEALESAALIDVGLERRPLAELLEYSLGSLGLAAEVGPERITVLPALARAPTRDEEVALASAAWARAARRFPRHPAAATAQLAQGELQELLGRQEAARTSYLDLLGSAPRSRAAAEAYLRAGRIAARRGEQGEAAEHFRALANLKGAEEYQAVARLELARATLALGDHGSALHILDALERTNPTDQRTELSARVLLRVEALLAAGRCQDALLELEARTGKLDALGERELPRLRARALEGAGLTEEASRAWLLVARAEPASRPRALAFERAGSLALASGDPLGVLFIVREAQACGLGATLAALERRARGELGVLEPELVTGERSASDRLRQAELLLERGRPAEAQALFDELFAERALLFPAAEERARLALGRARALCAAQGIDAAVRLLAEERRLMPEVEARGVLDVGAAELLEAQGLFERASEAYQGRYGGAY
jgi:TolA-binding protein